MERFTIGYRFVHTPDIQRYSLSAYSGGNSTQSEQQTKSGMNSHLFQATYLIPINNFNQIQIYASNTLRDSRGKTRDTSTGNDGWIENLKHIQDITNLYVSYLTYIRNFRIAVWARGEYSHLNLRQPGISDKKLISNDFYFIPRVNIAWYANRSTYLTLDYNEIMSRPTIQQLNPFYVDYNSFLSSEGNPDLRAERNRKVSLQLFKSFGALTTNLTASYTRVYNLIAGYSRLEGEKRISSFANAGNADIWEANINLDWRPKPFVSLSAYVNFGKRFLKGTALDIKQNDWFYNISPYLDFYLPYNWNIGLNYGLYKSLPSVYGGTRHLQLYSLTVGKSFLDGKLTLSARIDSPFSKHIKVENWTDIPGILHSGQTNYTTGRSASITVSYTISGGTKINLQRDRSLRPNDMNEGIN